MKRYAIGIDLGGTQIRAGLVDDDGQLLRRTAVRTLAMAGPDAVIDQLAGCLRTVTEGMSAAEIANVGLCAPGPLDADHGIALSIPTLRGFVDLQLAARLEQRSGHSVYLENDGIAAAYGEWRFGAGRGTDNLVYVTVSTGVGGGIVSDGRILRGSRGMAGHVGHMTVVADGAPCPCGNRGCWEAYASGTALARRANAEAPIAPSTTLGKDGRPIDALAVFEAARAGDALAAKLVEEEADYIGIGLSNLLHAFSPERVVIGGGVSNAFDDLLPGIRRRINISAMPPYRDVTIVRSTLGDDAGIIGTATLALEKAKRQFA